MKAVIKAGMLVTMLANIAYAIPAIRINNIKTLPSPMQSVENGGEGNFTFNIYEANNEDVPQSVSGDINTEITVDFNKAKLKDGDVANIFGEINNYFDINVLNAGESIVFEQKAVIPGDVFFPVRIAIEVTQNAISPTTNKVGGLANISATTGAQGDGSAYVFTLAPIDAVDDMQSGVNGASGGIVITDVSANDTFNGLPFTLGEDIAISSVGNSSPLIVDTTTGAVSVPAGTVAGSYVEEYTLCEIANPSNCDEAMVSVEVISAAMGGMDDEVSISSGVSGEVINNVTANDTLNGLSFTLGSDANITNVTTNTPYLEINASTGAVSVPENTPAGTYTEEYTVCENLNPSNCVTQEVSVTVEEGSLVANNDSNMSVNGVIGGVVIGNITANDSLNGMAVSLGEEVNLTTFSNNTPLEIDSLTGAVTLAVDTPAGIYTEDYTVCEVLNPSNCATANITVEVLLDSDKDGVVDEDDLDDDNDGILDTVEEQGTPNLDTDGDGVPDRLDLDSDNDGLLDLLESGQDPAVVDMNNDGILDSTTDNDQDGVMDVADMDDNNPTSAGSVTPVDTDGDGIRDFQDIDSDNDGISDLVEAGIDPSNDSDNDGRVDGAVDENGIPTTTTPVQTPANTDGDLVPDYRDLDSDNDGLNDVEEAGLTDSNGDGLDDTPNESLADPQGIPDEDSNGISNPLEPNNPDLPVEIDGNGDGIIDDTTDSDGDGIPDITDGRPENFATTPELDSDNDGIADVYDLDDDNDGILDTIEEQGSPELDTDGDGVPDRLDLDADNDGILDLVESGQDAAVVDSNNDGVLDSTTDVDNDGVMDVADADDNNPESAGSVTPIDTDGDGKRDFQELDSDNDGLSDMVEAGIPASNDEDNDGMVDHEVDTNGIPTVITPASNPVDTDGDMVPDYRDLDSDNDGLNDVEEIGGLDEDKDGLVDIEDSLVSGISLPDQDANNIPDVLEPNNDELPVLLDSNGDGIIDDATDSDNDGIPDVSDGQDSIFGTGEGKDSDGDGIKDEYDIDDDNDGIPDSVEAKGDANRDTDGDGIIDTLDLDSDNDGILDIIEALGVDSNNDGRVDDTTDTDKDGLADVVDASTTTPNNPLNENEGRLATRLLIPDTDQDGKDDFQDVDADNDGLSDLIEAGIPASNDEDNDGMIDGVVDSNGIPTTVSPVQTPLDSDSDNLPDYRELDSDNDGKKDLVEAGGEDSNNDGLIDTADELLDATNLPDIDENGVPNYREYNTQLVADVISDVAPGESVTIDVLQNDDLSGLDRETLQITGTGSPDESLIILGEGQWVVSSEQAIIFTPEEGFEGDPASISYSLENSNGERLETAQVTVNYLPVARADIKSTDLSEPVTIDVLANDSGDLDSSSVMIEMPEGFEEQHPDATLSEDGKSLEVPGQGTWSVNGDGTITYRTEPNAPIVNPTPVGYRVFDMQGNEVDTDATIVLNQSIVAEVTTDNNDSEACDPYEESSVDAVNASALLVLILLISALGLLLFRKD
jgi:hypothetical protein